MIDLESKLVNFNHSINILKERLNEEDDSKVYRILKSVMHTLRENITLEESIQLIAQLPFIMKAVYVENWKVHPKWDERKPKSIMDFINEVKGKHYRTLSYDFPNDNDVEHACRIVFVYLNEIISGGEMEDIRSVLPKRIKDLFILKHQSN